MKPEIGKKYKIIEVDAPIFNYLKNKVGTCTGFGKTGLAQITVSAGVALYCSADQLEVAVE